MTKQRPRRVGFGMKPREGMSAVAGQPGEAIESRLRDLSAGEGQEEAAEEVDSEAVVGEPEGGGLETSPLQNLESGEVEEAAEAENEPIVAPLSDFGPVPAVPQEAFDTLADLMKQSEMVTGAGPQFTVKPIPGREFSNFGGPTEEQLARSIYHEGKEKPELAPVIWEGTKAGQMTEAQVGAFQKAWNEVTFPNVPGQYSIGVDFGAGEDKSAAAVIRLENGASDELLETFDIPRLGELPNGEYRATVRVPEGYWEGVKSAAEADHVSVEDWLTNELAQRLEDTFFGRR